MTPPRLATSQLLPLTAIHNQSRRQHNASVPSRMKGLGDGRLMRLCIGGLQVRSPDVHMTGFRLEWILLTMAIGNIYRGVEERTWEVGVKVENEMKVHWVTICAMWVSILQPHPCNTLMVVHFRSYKLILEGWASVVRILRAWYRGQRHVRLCTITVSATLTTLPFVHRHQHALPNCNTTQKRWPPAPNRRTAHQDAKLSTSLRSSCCKDWRNERFKSQRQVLHVDSTACPASLPTYLPETVFALQPSGPSPPTQSDATILQLPSTVAYYCTTTEFARLVWLWTRSSRVL